MKSQMMHLSWEPGDCLGSRSEQTQYVLRFARSLAMAVLTTCALASHAMGQMSFEEAPINYSQAAVNDPVSRLQKKLDAGEVKLQYDPQFGYLKSILDHLNIPASSQALVFSKTSFQLRRISPRSPRALSSTCCLPGKSN